MRADKLTTTFFVKTEDQELKDFLTSQNIDYSSRPSTNLIGVEAESEKQFLQWMEEYKNLKLTNTMKQKKFDAILAKNEIARELAEYVNSEYINVAYFYYKLQELENYLGVGNQPSVEEIINNNTDKEKQFDI